MTTNGSAAEQSAEDEEIAALFPQAIEFKAGDKVIASLLPMDLDQCFDFLASIKPIVANLLEVGGAMDAKRFAEIMLAAEAHRADVYRALSIATGRTPRFISKLPLGVPMALMQAVWQVNVDFFVRAVGSLTFLTTDSATAEASAKNGNGLNN